MDFEKLWYQILCTATEAAFDVATVPQNNRTPLWFNVYTKEAYLYVDNTSDNSPSVRLSGARRITKDDFLNVAGYKKYRLYFWIDISILKSMIII